MTTEPQAEPLAELITKLQNSLTELQAQHAAELTAAKVAYDAKQAEMKQQSALRQAFRGESWAWRELAGVPQTLTPLSPAEVAAKKI